MPRYTVSVRSKGKIKNIELTAANPEVASRQAKRLGTVLRVNRAHASTSGKGMNSEERYTFLIRMATMLASKVSVTDGLKLLRDSFGGRIGKCCSDLLEKVELGTDLASAIHEDTKNFPGAMGLIVKVGAQSGQTYRALQEAADFERQLKAVRQSAGQGLIGALIGFIFAGGLMVVSTTYLGPKLNEMQIIQAMQDQIDIGWVNDLAMWSGIVMAVVVALILALVWLATVGRFIFPNFADRIINRIPYYNEIVLSQESYIALYRLSLMIRAGVRMEDALKASYDGTRAGVLKEDFARCLDLIKKGKKWAQGMTLLHPTDRAALMLASDRDQIATNLDNVRSQLQAMYMQRVSTLAPVLQVVAAIGVCMAGVVLFGQSLLPILQASVGIIRS